MIAGTLKNYYGRIQKTFECAFFMDWKAFVRGEIKFPEMLLTYVTKFSNLIINQRVEKLLSLLYFFSDYFKPFVK